MDAANETWSSFVIGGWWNRDTAVVHNERAESRALCGVEECGIVLAEWGVDLLIMLYRCISEVPK